jgi:FkbM family methyltransferase
MSLRTAAIRLSGYWMYKLNKLPIGCDLIPDIKNKIRMPVRVIFDVGANVGQTAKRFTNAFPDARIFSFEPVASTFSLLKRNVSNLSNVTCYHSALGEQVKDLEITTYTGKDSLLNSLNAVSMNTGGQLETIHVDTGDAFSAANGIGYVDLLKIDTEGYELEVLKGCKEMLTTGTIKSVFCEVGFNRSNQRNTYLADIMEFLNPLGYEFYGLYDMYNKRMNAGSDYGSVLFVKP